MEYKTALTLTFGDAAENHVNMQMLGGLSDKGFTLSDLQSVADRFEDTQIINLNNYIYPQFRHLATEDAHVLIIRNGINFLFDDNIYADKLYEEQMGLETDKKAFMYGRVVNKHARHNLCFGYESQEPDYEKGKGRVYSFDQVPHLNEVLDRFHKMFKLTKGDLYAEGNYYYDPSKTGIGYHGDSERRKVIGVRLGVPINLCYVWYYEGEKASDRILMPMLEHGDIYVMSEKAVGNDWKKKKILTLRHAAGCFKYTDV